MSDSLNSILQKASDLIARSDYTGAADALGSIFQKEPNNPAALRMLAEAMHHVGEAEQALALLSDSISAGGAEAATLCRIAEILKELKREHEAADFLIFASEVSPKDQNLLSDAASTLIRLGRNDEAVALLSHASSQTN
jgi:thioredoxin-like negative regulator of GroEL